MRKYLISYNSFLFEESNKSDNDDSNKKSLDRKASNVAKKIANKVFKKSADDLKDKNVIKNKDGETVTVPKDLQLKKLAKELYKAQYDVATFKYVLADKIAVMKKEGADEDIIEKAEEMGDDQMANVQMRADAINMQMIAVAGQNTNLALKAEELAQGAINAALKAAQEFYDKRGEKWLKDSQKKKEKKEDKNE